MIKEVYIVCYNNDEGEDEIYYGSAAFTDYSKALELSEELNQALEEEGENPYNFYNVVTLNVQ